MAFVRAMSGSLRTQPSLDGRGGVAAGLGDRFSNIHKSSAARTQAAATTQKAIAVERPKLPWSAPAANGLAASAAIRNAPKRGNHTRGARAVEPGLFARN